MSSNWYIHLEDEVFPEATWQEVLRAFGATGKSPVEWNIETKDGVVWLALGSLKPSSLHAGRFRWEIVIDLSGGGAHASWTVYSLGYWCLSLMNNVSFVDGYNGDRLATPESLEAYADGRLKARIGLSKFMKMGVLDGDEKLQLGVVSPPDR